MLLFGRQFVGQLHPIETLTKHQGGLDLKRVAKFCFGLFFKISDFRLPTLLAIRDGRILRRAIGLYGWLNDL